ncbi:MAG: hypothetical protein M4579_002795 [Chaenotheca gracillima]|nr:MAG: hypothetical protein M4579_002795 [Chaenotheca gracillima]
MSLYREEQKPRTTLADLPPEILTQIIAFLTSARSVAGISSTCHLLHDLVIQQGWRVFVQCRFPSIPVTPFGDETWAETADRITALSRSWDRRAFLAQHLQIPDSVERLPARPLSTPNVHQAAWRVRPGARQTMGYHPVIDSYESPASSGERKEVVAWGAGSALICRIKGSGAHSEGPSWISYEDDSYKDGKDDITAVVVLRPHQVDSTQYAEEVIVGRASGHLAKIPLASQAFETGETSIKMYDTQSRPVRSVHMSSSSKPIIAACLSDDDLAIFSVHGDPESGNPELITPKSEIKLGRGRKGERTWSTKFLSNSRLAIGLGPSTEPIQIYELREDELSHEPLRKFCTSQEGTSAGSVDMLDELPEGTSSVYPVEGLGIETLAGRGNGDVFLAGWYDGVCRLHDMRSPESYVSSYYDPVGSASSIYSLASFGLERFAAGTARHSSIQVFDLRMAGEKVYDYANVDAHLSGDIMSKRDVAVQYDGEDVDLPTDRNLIEDSRDWTIFLTPREANQRYFAERQSRNWSRQADSPVYSLSTPSAGSSSLYAGIEGGVVELNFVSSGDEIRGIHRDLLRRTPRNGIAAASSVHLSTAAHETFLQKWDPDQRVVNLAAYGQIKVGKLALRTQASLRDLPAEDIVAGQSDRPVRCLDIRWAPVQTPPKSYRRPRRHR